MQHPVAAQRPSHRVGLRHIDRHARDLDGPDGRVDHRLAIPDRADVDEVSGTSGRGLAKEANELSIIIHFESNDE